MTTADYDSIFYVKVQDFDSETKCINLPESEDNFQTAVQIADTKVRDEGYAGAGVYRRIVGDPMGGLLYATKAA